MKSNKMKRTAVIVLGAFMILSLAACGDSGDLNDNYSADSDTNLKDNSSLLSEEDSSEQEQSQTIDQLISISDVSIAPIEVYSASVDSYEPDPGYIIEATVSNENDVSCDVSPFFSVQVTDEDDYGKPRTRNMVLLNSAAVFSPYGPDLPYYQGDALVPVGLAPHETKTVRYYVQTASSNPIRVSALNSGSGSSGYGEEKLYSSNKFSLSNIKLLSFQVKEADQVYVSSEKWNIDARLEEVDFSMPGLTSYGNILTGTLTNNTDDQWEKASIQFDLSVNGQTLNTAAIKKTYQSFTYVDVGKNIPLRDESPYATSESVASYESQNYKMELTPALLMYTPENKNNEL